MLFSVADGLIHRCSILVFSSREKDEDSFRLYYGESEVEATEQQSRAAPKTITIMIVLSAHGLDPNF